MRRTVRRVLFAFVVVIAAAPAETFAQPPLGESQKMTWKKYKEAVVHLRVFGRNRQGVSVEVQGTGFFFHRDGFLITAAHVIGTREDWFDNNNVLDRKIKLKTEATDGTQKRQENSEDIVVLYVDRQLDLALLRVRGMYPDGKYPVVTLGNSSIVNATDSVLAAGWGDRSSPVPAPGTVQTAFDPRAYGQFRLRVDLAKGDSGGPVFNKDDHVIGVIALGDRRADDRPSFAQPINLAANLVNFTMRAAALEETMSALNEMQGPIRQFEPVRLGFEKVAKSIQALEGLAEQLKRTTRPTVTLRREKNPVDNPVYLYLQFHQDFASQYLPEYFQVTVNPAWEIDTKSLKDEDRRGVPGAMSSRESAAADLRYEVDKSRFDGPQVGWNILDPLRVQLKQKYKASSAALQSLRIVGVEVEVQWWFKGDPNPYRDFYQNLRVVE